MKYNQAVRLGLLALLLLVLFPAPAGRAEEQGQEASEAPGEVLVIYPEEADQRTKEDPLSALAQVLLSLRVQADFVEAGEAAGRAGQYDRVIWCNTTATNRMDPGLLEGYEGSLLVMGQAAGLEAFGLRAEPGWEGSSMGVGRTVFDDDVPFVHSVPLLNAGALPEASYTNGTLTSRGGVLPMASGNGQAHYLALTDYGDAFSRSVLLQEIAQWLWPYESRMHLYTAYVVLDGVYPFYDPYRLKDLVDYMVERKMVFVISVMPVYEHADYPAMAQFCEVLRYAQANGGAIILHAPIIQNGTEPEELAEHLTTATCHYFDQNVYPLALEIPSEWLFREELQPILGRYRTLFLSDMNAFAQHSPGEYSLGSYLRLGSQQIVPAARMEETGISHQARCATAIYLDLGTTADEALITTIEAARNAPVPMHSLWGMDQAVYTNDGFFLTWDQNTLTVNGEQRFPIYIPMNEEEPFDYRRNEYYRFVANLNNQNHFLIAVSGAVLVLFLALARQSRRQMHRRFLRKKAETAGKDANVGS